MNKLWSVSCTIALPQEQKWWKSLPRKTQEVWYSDSSPTGDASLYAIQTMMASMWTYVDIINAKKK